MRSLIAFAFYYKFDVALFAVKKFNEMAMRLNYAHPISLCEHFYFTNLQNYSENGIACGNAR